MNFKKYEKEITEHFENYSLTKDFIIGILSAALMFNVWECESLVQTIVISLMFAFLVAWILFWIDDGCIWRMKYKARKAAIKKQIEKTTKAAKEDNAA